jgi:hypothetical protein
MVSRKGYDTKETGWGDDSDESIKKRELERVKGMVGRGEGREGEG